MISSGIQVFDLITKQYITGGDLEGEEKIEINFITDETSNVEKLLGCISLNIISHIILIRLVGQLIKLCGWGTQNESLQ